MLQAKNFILQQTYCRRENPFIVLAGLVKRDGTDIPPFFETTILLYRNLIHVLAGREREGL